MERLAFNAVILCNRHSHSAAGKKARLFYNELGFMSLVDITS